MVNYNYINNYRDKAINTIFLARSNKFSLKKEEDLNTYFENNINNTITNDTKYSFLKNFVKVKKCNLLHCELSFNGSDLEFENGNLVTVTEEIINNTNINIVKELIEKETKEIREMLCLPLTLNMNLASLGYIMDTELLKVVSFYNEKNIENFSDHLIVLLASINGKDAPKKYTPVFQNFPKEHINSNDLYPSYCHWLSILDHSPDYNSKDNIPKSYQKYLENNENQRDFDFLKEINEGEKNETTLKIISLGDEEEFCELMTGIMQSTESFTKKDINDLNQFAYHFTDYVNYIPQPIENIENIGHIISIVLSHFRGTKPPFDTYLSWLNHIDKTFDNILTIIIAFSDHVDIASDLKKYREFIYPDAHQEKFIMKLLNECSGENRYEEFVKNKDIWARLCEKINTDNYMNEYPELVKDLLKVSKEKVFNFIFINRRCSIMDDGRENLDDLYKKNMNQALQKSDALSSASVKSCNLLNCVISINDKDFEFENGKLLDSYDEEEDENDAEAFLKPLKTLVNKETKVIRQKLNFALSLNENITLFGYCLDIPLMKKVAVYDSYEIEEFYQSMVNALQKLTNFKTNYEPIYPDFPREHLSMELTYKYYCQWLFTLEMLNYDPKMIPMSYQVKFEEYKDVEDVKKKLKDVSLKTLSISATDEFYKMMMKLMDSSEAVSKNDLADLHSFIKYEENRLNYIPETIKNKENLANVINKLLLYCMSEPPLEFIMPRFKVANDVLRLALVMSGHQASDLGKSVKFKSFKNSERRILMALLNHCDNRYEDILKYKNMWVRFCERVHPNKFKSCYPDVINDLQGHYSILGKPENKEIRVEYRFYQTLMELDDRFKEYKENVLKYIQEMRKKREEERIKELEQEKSKSVKNGDNSEGNSVRQRLNRMKNRRIENPNDTLNPDKLLTIAEHQNLLRKFNSIKNMPKEIKEYVHHYLMVIAGIAYTGNFIQSMNCQYIDNINCKQWDGWKEKYVIKKGYEEVHEELPDVLLEIYDSFIPPFNREIVKNRIKALEPSILQLRQQSNQYKSDRQTFSSKWVQLLKEKNIKKAIKLLSQKPGIYMRHLDELITKCENEEEVKEVKTFFERVAEKGSVKILLSMKAYFQKRNKAFRMRAFLIKGNNNNKTNKNGKKNSYRKVNTNIQSTIYYTDKVKTPLKEDLCQQIIHICDSALHIKFKDKPKLNGVYINPQLQKILIPFDLRNSSKSLENYTKGSRFELSFKNITQEEKEEMIKETEKALQEMKEKEMKIFSEKKKHEVDLLNLNSRIEKKTKEIELATTTTTATKKAKAEIKEMKKDLEKDIKIKLRCTKALNESTAKLSAIEKDLIILQKDLKDKKQCPTGVSY
ncbi:hypothetical protein BCR36DRAFT_579279, partial [Piromyces finnis]